MPLLTELNRFRWRVAINITRLTALQSSYLGARTSRPHRPHNTSFRASRSMRAEMPALHYVSFFLNASFKPDCA
jgi:hypothetical protein